MVTVIITAFMGIVPSVISGVVLFKVQTSKKESDLKHEKNVTAALHDRELLLSIAEVSEMTARKIKGENLNGELAEALNELVNKRNEVTRFTNTEYFNALKK